MRDQKILGMVEAYSSIYAPQEEEIVSEDLQQKVGQALDAAAKNPVVKAIGSAIAPVGKGRKTPTAASGGYRPVKEEAETDFFDYLLEYLVAEGYADTNKAALAIMANMSEEWKQSIVEGESARIAAGGGRTVGPLGGAIRAVFSGNLPAGKVNVPTKQTGPNRPPAVPSSKDDSGKLTDFGAGGGKAKLKTGMSVGQVERQGRMNKGDYSG